MILHELRQHGLVPDEVMLNAAISACEKSEQWQWALHLLAIRPAREVICDRRSTIDAFARPRL